MASKLKEKSKESKKMRVIWTQQDAKNYFRSVTDTEISSMSADKLETLLNGIQTGLLYAGNSISLAAFTKCIGVEHLNEDNQVKAKPFFEQSVQFYKDAKKVGSNNV